EFDFKNVRFYFIDNEYYFKRETMYGFYDDGERFAYFSRAVLEALSHVDFSPDVIHCNDWQTALVPVYLNLYYRHSEKHSGVRTIFTIHDLQHQGRYGPETLEETLGIARENFHIVEFDGAVNYTKGALETSDLINTLSPTYAREVTDPWYGHGLYDLLREKRDKLRGILNGMDTEAYDPVTDAEIAFRYDASNFERGRAMCKKNLKDIFGLAKSDAPLIGMVTPFEFQKGLDLVLYMAEEIMDGGIQFAVVGGGGGHYERFFEELAAKHAGQFAVKTGMPPKLTRRVYAGSDMFLMPSRTEPCGLAQMLALRYGSVPVVRETGGLRDTVVNAGDDTGNGFTFAPYNADDMRDACFRGRDMYGDRDRWRSLVRRCMESDNGWALRAKEYAALYEEAVKLR
ncbi:MAG: glycogen synthase, partial [Synergistaceae bacterium]|nr:glycogen synthase [Synergistaceae bacterium]